MRTVRTLEAAHQQADAETMLRVTLEAAICAGRVRWSKGLDAHTLDPIERYLNSKGMEFPPADLGDAVSRAYWHSKGLDAPPPDMTGRYLASKGLAPGLSVKVRNSEAPVSGVYLTFSDASVTLVR